MTATLWTHRWVTLGLRWLLGLVFLYAGLVKLGSPQDFADNIAGFQLLPASLVNLLALGLPPFEIGVGVLLLLGRWKRAALLAATGMTAIFAVAMASALARGLNVDCGCFGPGVPSRWKTWLSLVRDFLLLATAAFLYLRTTRDEPS